MTGVPASPSGQSGQAPEPAPRLGHSATVPNADDLLNLIIAVERSEKGDPALDARLSQTLDIWWMPGREVAGPWTQSIDAALMLLPTGADWRRLCHRGIAAYAANPYNPQAQKRHDGWGKTVPLQICAAALKVRLEPLMKAERDAARKVSA